MSHPRGKTRKNKTKSRKHGKVLTIPELRHSLEHISNYTDMLVRSGNASVKDVAASFAVEWKKVFGKTLSPKVAESYIKTMMKKKGKGTRKLRGGAAILTGAPLEALTRPDTDLPYGKFPSYVSGGFVNPEPAILKDCGTQQGILPQAGMGSNRMNGGGIFDYVFPVAVPPAMDIFGPARQFANAATFRPFLAQNPTTPQHDMMTGIKGMSSPSGPESWQHSWKSHTNPNTPTGAPTVGIYNRTLSNDIIVPGK
jgi:hypothetical protein